MKVKNPFVLETIIDEIPYFVFWKDINLNYLGCNHAFAKSAGYDSPQDLIGKSDYDCCWKKEESEFFRSIDKKIMESGVPILNIEEPQKQLDGEIKTLLTSKVPLKNEKGECVGILGIYTDITERKRLEIEKDDAIKELQRIQKILIYQEKMKSLGEMAGGIAHEINNPLAIISGYVQLIKTLVNKGPGSEAKILETCDKVYNTVKRCTDIVHNLKKFSRDGERDEVSKLNLELVLDSFLSFSQEMINSRSYINLEVQKYPVFILGKQISIEQALTNLVSNAIDELEKSGLHKLVIRTFNNGPRAGIEVLNEGAPIDSKVAERMFDPFYTTKAVGKGTGLGLSTSRGIVEKSGGTLSYTRKDDMNAFVISYNRVKEEELQKSTYQDVKIFILDDEPELGIMLKESLELSLDCVIETFTSAQCVLDAIEKGEKPDFLISDIQMPGIDGVMLLSRIRSDNKINPKVIMMSGFSQYTPDEVRAKGADFYISKPIDIDLLVSFIKTETVDNQSTEEEASLKKTG